MNAQALCTTVQLKQNSCELLLMKSAGYEDRSAPHGDRPLVLKKFLAQRLVPSAPLTRYVVTSCNVLYGWLFPSSGSWSSFICRFFHTKYGATKSKEFTSFGMSGPIRLIRTISPEKRVFRHWLTSGWQGPVIEHPRHNFVFRASSKWRKNCVAF